MSREETLLRLLPGHWLSQPSIPALQEGARAAAQPVERYLVEHGVVARPELVSVLLEMKGVASRQLEGDSIELRLPHSFPLARALELHLLPLTHQRTRLYCLAEPDVALEQRAAWSRQHGVELVVLGTPENLLPRIHRTYAELERLDPGDLTFPQYLRRLGLVDSAAAEALSSDHSLAGWTPRVRALGLTEDALYAAASAFFNVPLLTRDRMLELVDDEVLRHVPHTYMEANGTLPLRIEGGKLWVASVDVPELQPLEVLAHDLGCSRVQFLAAPPSALKATLEELFGGGESPRAGAKTLGGTPLSNPRGVPAIVEELLYEAVRRGCSDIHLERFERRVDVRLRKDGNLSRMNDARVTAENVQAVVTRLKVEARLDITETRRPQDGVLRRRYEHGQVDFRVATQPTLWGENVAIRVLHQVPRVPKLEELGFEPEVLARLRRLLANPQGLVLVTGPTGSGKTTTLYGLLQELKKPDTKLLTAEDPIEYAIDGIQQSQVDEAIGNTFDLFVRAFMRQDPDVILVGEIRDGDTARSTLRAALTGHLILSTVHANDVFGVVRRVVDLGVEESLLSQTLLCVVGQRLARRVCLGCAEPYVPGAELVAEFLPNGVPPDAKPRRGRGCEACEGTGYSGRTALFEYWEPNDRARLLLERGADGSALRAEAVKADFHSLLEHGVRLALEGVTTLEELRAVVPYEQIARRPSGA